MYKKKGKTVPKRVKAINPMLILVAFLVIAAIGLIWCRQAHLTVLKMR